MEKRGPLAGSVGAEFSGADFGDARLTKRAVSVAESIAAAPGKSFPKLAGSDGELEGMYRFYNNENVTPEKVLAPHFRATARRSAEAGTILALHDTTEAKFTGDRDGLGLLLDHIQGFLCHVTMAVDAREATPLGVLAMEVVLRDVAPKENRLPLKERKRLSREQPREEKESSRWERGVRAAQATLTKGTNVIHVVDQEGNDFTLLAALVSERHRFIVRGSPNRLEHMGGRNLHTIVSAEPAVFSREVVLSARPKVKARPNKGRPERATREARLEVRATSIELGRTQLAQTDVESIPVNLVQVLEPNPPDGEQPIEWMLLTTEPISTREELETVIDGYRARWRIEEFFKALKTGCALEKRQLGSKHALLNALAVFMPIAWRLLLLRNLGRSEEARQATDLFSAAEIQMVRLLSKRVALTETPTIREMMFAIAGLGGHLKRNGDPGWETLGAGFERLIEAMNVKQALSEM